MTGTTTERAKWAFLSWSMLILVSFIGCTIQNQGTTPYQDDNQEKPPEVSRFERADPSEAAGTSKIRNRYDLESPDWLRKISIGDFVCRIWTLFGPPDSVDYEGFDYAFRDKETGLIFTAYSAGSGPAYGGFQEQAEQLAPVIDAFDRLLEATIPADCEIEYNTGFGRYRSGVRNGVPFDEPVE